MLSLSLSSGEQRSTHFLDTQTHAYILHTHYIGFKSCSIFTNWKMLSNRWIKIRVKFYLFACNICIRKLQASVLSVSEQSANWSNYVGWTLIARIIFSVIDFPYCLTIAYSFVKISFTENFSFLLLHTNFWIRIWAFSLKSINSRLNFFRY